MYISSSLSLHDVIRVEVESLNSGGYTITLVFNDSCMKINVSRSPSILRVPMLIWDQEAAAEEDDGKWDQEAKDNDDE